MPTNFSSEIATTLPGPAWLKDARANATRDLLDAPWPSAQDEIWRYSRIDDLDIDVFQPARQRSLSANEMREVDEIIGGIGEHAALVVTCNGAIVRSDVDASLEERGLQITDADDSTSSVRSMVEGVFGRVASYSDAFQLLNTAFAIDPVFIRVASGLTVDRPVVVVHWISENNSGIFPRTVVQCEKGSKAIVCEYVASSDVDVHALAVPVTEIVVEPGAILDYVNVQAVTERIWQIGYQASRVDTDASLVSTSIALGGDYARVRTDSHLTGKGAVSKLNAAYFGARHQMHDFRTLQAHEAPKTTSDLLFKGAVGDASHSVYSGLIRVDKGASGTNAYQTNRNLVLSENAHADSVPTLEIEEMDVRCSHASAVGPVDEEQRYYLESRGVPPQVASRLIVLGFLSEVISALPIDGLRTSLSKKVAEKLSELNSVIASQ